MRRKSNFQLARMPLDDTPNNRAGHMLPFFAVLIPALLGILGLAIDGSMLRVKSRLVQNVADAAAIAAAAALADGQSVVAAQSVAVDSVTSENGLSAASVTVQIPPVDGPYVGRAGYAQVHVSMPVSTFVIQAVGNPGSYTVRAGAVAGSKSSTAGADIVVLDPDPPGITTPVVAGLSLPATPSLSLGGLEVLGIGQVQINGAVLVNTTWGGVDQNGQTVGEPALLRAAVTCMPLVPLTSLATTNLRVTGGVDNQRNYVNYTTGQASPLKANQKPVPDPLSSLPSPTVGVDPVNVSDTLKGGVSVTSLPLIGAKTTLEPGVYDYIHITSGDVVFKSGVYIIRGTHPVTRIALNIVAGSVTARGVMFYITDSTNYSASTASPNAGDSDTTPAPLSVTQLPPSVVLNVGLLGSYLSPLSGTGSPYDGILLYQARTDRRLIIVNSDLLLLPSSYSGTIYAKWGHVIFAGMGTLDARFVVGSIRFIAVGDLKLQPSQLLPPAQDVYLVQ